MEEDYAKLERLVELQMAYTAKIKDLERRQAKEAQVCIYFLYAWMPDCLYVCRAHSTRCVRKSSIRVAPKRRRSQRRGDRGAVLSRATRPRPLYSPAPRLPSIGSMRGLRHGGRLQYNGVWYSLVEILMPRLCIARDG